MTARHRRFNSQSSQTGVPALRRIIWVHKIHLDKLPRSRRTDTRPTPIHYPDPHHTLPDEVRRVEGPGLTETYTWNGKTDSRHEPPGQFIVLLGGREFRADSHDTVKHRPAMIIDDDGTRMKVIYFGGKAKNKGAQFDPKLGVLVVDRISGQEEPYWYQDLPGPRTSVIWEGQIDEDCDSGKNAEHLSVKLAEDRAVDPVEDLLQELGALPKPDCTIEDRDALDPRK